MFSNVITIVGGGASCVSFVQSLLEGLSKISRCPPVTVFIIDKQSQCGRGLAYSDDCLTNLLNTRAEYISPFSELPGHFYSWLLANREVWEDDFPEVDVFPQAFLPRPLFGRYLAHMSQCLGAKAVALGCQLIPIHDEAVGISFSHDGRVVVSTRGNLSFPSDHVVLSCGNACSLKYRHLVHSQGFFSSPYPIKRTCRLIPKHARVAIVGSRLSAIDSLIGLSANGHVGSITLHSRTGALPCVRGAQGRYQPKILTPETVSACISKAGVVRLEDAIRWTLQEMVAAGEILSLKNWCSECTQKPAMEFLEKEIAAARFPRLWQSVLYSTNTVLDLIWPAMPDEDKRNFLRYSSLWTTFRVSIPLENALKVKSLLESSQLSVVQGELENISNDGTFKLEVSTSGTKRSYEYEAVIIATGTPRDVTQFDNPLVQNILDLGVASADSFGGVRICPLTGGLINHTGHVDQRITVLGELTSGAFFFTSALEINARHAAQRAKEVIARLVCAGEHC